jgi:alkanesulfonate monooxygenase SsuD/methylene tetrahydromethanopterin reductase-like flavin-dependent oxidoreductase (luciferase family)
VSAGVPTGLETGIQIHLPTHHLMSTTDLRELAYRVAGQGVDQLWFTDNLGCRNLPVVLAALAPAPVRLGAAVMVQYFRSPVEAAAALATVTELTAGRELSVGLGAGNLRTSRQLDTPRAITFMRETARFLRELWSGNEVRASGYPLLAGYFHLAEGSAHRLSVAPRAPLPLYGGGSGPLGIKAARELMDGMVLNGSLFLSALTLGRLPRMIEASRPAHPGPDGFRRVADLKIAVHARRELARDFARRSVGQRMLSVRRSGVSDDELRVLGVEPRDVDALAAAFATGAGPRELAPLVTDAMVDAVFIAGEPAECRERLAEVAETARQLDIHQLMFSEIGPEGDASVSLLLKEVVSCETQIGVRSC